LTALAKPQIAAIVKKARPTDEKKGAVLFLAPIRTAERPLFVFFADIGASAESESPLAHIEPVASPWYLLKGVGEIALAVLRLHHHKEESMSIFGKKSEGEHFGSGRAGASRHGIGDVIRLLRTLPVDQNADLVIRVIRSTLESLEVVHVSDLIQDAVKQEQKLGDRIAALRAQMQELTKQIEIHGEEVSRLEADLSETSVAKERLQFAEQTALAEGQVASSSPSSLRAPGPLPPPQLPSRPKSSPPVSLDPAHHDARG
jgi:hypothetical protein